METNTSALTISSSSPQISERHQTDVSSAAGSSPLGIIGTDSTISSATSTTTSEQASNSCPYSIIDCISGTFTSILNIPSHILKFFNDLVSYCLSFCFTGEPTPIPPTEPSSVEAVHAFIEMHYAKTQEEQANTLLSDFETLPDSAKDCMYLFIRRLIQWENTTLMMLPEAKTRIENYLKNHPTILVQPLLAWIIAQTWIASNQNTIRSSDNLHAEEILEMVNNFTQYEPAGTPEQIQQNLLDLINPLPEYIKEFLYTFCLLPYVTSKARELRDTTSLATLPTLEQYRLVRQTIPLNDSIAVDTEIKNSLRAHLGTIQSQLSLWLIDVYVQLGVKGAIAYVLTLDTKQTADEKDFFTNFNCLPQEIKDPLEIYNMTALAFSDATVDLANPSTKKRVEELNNTTNTTIIKGYLSAWMKQRTLSNPDSNDICTLPKQEMKDAVETFINTVYPTDNAGREQASITAFETLPQPIKEMAYTCIIMDFLIRKFENNSTIDASNWDLFDPLSLLELWFKDDEEDFQWLKEQVVNYAHDGRLTLIFKHWLQKQSWIEST